MHAGREEKIVQLGLEEARGARETSAGCSGPRHSDSGLRGHCWGYKCTIGVGKGTIGLGDSATAGKRARGESVAVSSSGWTAAVARRRQGEY